MQSFILEFILHSHECDLLIIKNSLSEFGQGLEISECLDIEKSGKSFKIQINTEEPTLIFDACSQLGRIKSVKVNEIKT